MLEINKTVIAILKRLLSKKRIGDRHTEEKNVFRWIKNLSPKEQKVTRDDWERCIKQYRLVLREKKTGQLHVSINPEKLPEIREIIQSIKSDN